MNFKEIVELIEKVAALEIAEVEIEQAGTKLRIQGKHTPPPALPQPSFALAHPGAMPALRQAIRKGALVPKQVVAVSDAMRHRCMRYGWAGLPS